MCTENAEVSDAGLTVFIEYWLACIDLFLALHRLMEHCQGAVVTLTNVPAGFYIFSLLALIELVWFLH